MCRRLGFECYQFKRERLREGIDNSNSLLSFKDVWVLHSLGFLEDFDHQTYMLLAFTMLSFAQMIETDEDFSPFPGGYDYLVDFLDLSFPKERPSREHPYEEVSSKLLLPVYLSSFLFKSTFYFRVVLDLQKSLQRWYRRSLTPSFTVVVVTTNEAVLKHNY